MKPISLICYSLIIGFSIATPRKTGEEVSSQDIGLLKEYCNIETDIEVLTVNIGDPLKPLFSRNNWRECENRLSSNTFIWIDARNIREIEDLAIRAYLYTRETHNRMVNLARPSEVLKIRNREYNRRDVIAEIPQENVHETIKIKRQVARMRRKLEIVDYGYHIANGQGKIELKDVRRICLDFDGYSQLLLKRLSFQTVFKRSLCYDQLRNVALLMDLQPMMSYRVSGQKEVVVYEAEVELPLQLSNGRGITTTLSVLTIEEELAVKTIKATPKIYNAATFNQISWLLLMILLLILLTS